MHRAHIPTARNSRRGGAPSPPCSCMARSVCCGRSSASSTRRTATSPTKSPEAPAYTVAAGGMYRDVSGWFAGANMRYTDGYYNVGDLANTLLRFVDGYTTVDVRWETEHYTFTVFTKNVFDEQYVTSIESGR